jgi:hypothetical protein
MLTGFWSKNLTGRGPLGKPRYRWEDRNGISVNVVWSGFNWLRVGSSGGLLRTFRFHRDWDFFFYRLSVPRPWNWLWLSETLLEFGLMEDLTKGIEYS